MKAIYENNTMAKIKPHLFDSGGGSFVLCGQGSSVQPTLDPSAETFISVQCASPGRGGELVGVYSVCVRCVRWNKEQQALAACQAFLSAPPLDVD